MVLRDVVRTHRPSMIFKLTLNSLINNPVDYSQRVHLQLDTLIRPIGDQFILVVEVVEECRSPYT